MEQVLKRRLPWFHSPQ